MAKPGEASETEKQDAPPTVRDSLVAALKEQRDGPEDEEDKEEEIEEENDDDLSDDPAGEGILEDDDKKALKKVAKTKKPDTEEAEEIEEEPTSEEEEVEIEAPVKEPKAKKKDIIPAPKNWEGDPDWDKTPASVRQKIIKREEEVSNGFKQYGDKARAFDEYERIIGPRRQSMAGIGVSPVQVIHRALEWMDVLGHPDPKVKSEGLKLLANNFGIDIASLAGGQSSGESFRVGADSGEVPDQVKTYVSSLEQKIAGLEQQLGGVVNNFQSQQDRAAQEYLSQWASDKPHFAQVQPLMLSLIRGGSVPLKDGTLDLDAAYDMAVNANPQIRELVRLENADKARKEAEAKSKKERQGKQLALNKARAANGSLKPGSPTSPSLRKNATGLNVRDTIKLSMKQLQQADG